ncbi:MAG: hypothetical protein ACK56I_12610, partial [bacterium]
PGLWIAKISGSEIIFAETHSIYMQLNRPAGVSVWCVCVCPCVWCTLSVARSQALLAVPARPAGLQSVLSSPLVPDGRIQGRWTQKWPIKISSQRPRKRPNLLIAA